MLGAVRVGWIALALVGCSGDRLVFGELTDPAPSALVGRARNPARGVLAFEPLPKLLELDGYDGEALDVLTYERPLSTYDLIVSDGRLELDPEGTALPAPHRWLSGGEGDELLLPQNPSDAPRALATVRARAPRCAGLASVASFTLEAVERVLSLSRIDPTSALLVVETATASVRAVSVDLTALAQWPALASGPGASVAAVNTQQMFAWVGVVEGSTLTMTLRNARGSAFERHVLAWPYGPLVKLAGAEVDGVFELLWATASEWGRIELASERVTRLGGTRLADCADAGGPLELFEDGTGIVGFNSGSLLAVDLAGNADTLVRANPTPCRSAYARKGPRGRELVITDQPGQGVTTYWRDDRAEEWKSAPSGTLTARAALYMGDDALVAAGSGDVVVSLVPDLHENQAPVACQVVPHGGKVTHMLSMDRYVIATSYPDATSGLLKVEWIEVLEGDGP